MDFTSEVKWNEIKSSHKNLWGCWCFSMNLLSSLFSVKTRFSCFFLFLLLVFSELSVFCFFIIMCYVEPYRLEQMCMFGVTDVDETNICNQCFEDGRKKESWKAEKIKMCKISRMPEWTMQFDRTSALFAIDTEQWHQVQVSWFLW